MSQSHFTLSFPLKSPADAKVLAELLPPLMPGLFQAQDAIGTIHYSRFTVLSEKTLLFVGDFDGEFGQLMAGLAAHSGPVFDAIFQHVVKPPALPVADHTDTFVEWTADHLLDAINLYTAYPGVTVKEVKSLASAAEISSCFCGSKTDPAGARSRNHARPGQSWHPSFCPVCATRRQPGWFLYRV